ncbi:MAG: hypothetical protein Fur003_0270 [Candidatus Dojkabacteria bacterium]
MSKNSSAIIDKFYKEKYMKKPLAALMSAAILTASFTGAAFAGDSNQTGRERVPSHKERTASNINTRREAEVHDEAPPEHKESEMELDEMKAQTLLGIDLRISKLTSLGVEVTNSTLLSEEQKALFTEQINASIAVLEGLKVEVSAATSVQAIMEAKQMAKSNSNYSMLFNTLMPFLNGLKAFNATKAMFISIINETELAQYEADVNAMSDEDPNKAVALAKLSELQSVYTEVQNHLDLATAEYNAINFTDSSEVIMMHIAEARMHLQEARALFPELKTLVSELKVVLEAEATDQEEEELVSMALHSFTLMSLGR